MPCFWKKTVPLHSQMKRVVVTKRKFLAGFIVVTLVLSLVKCIFPSVAVKDDGGVIAAMDSVAEMPVVEDTVVVDPRMAGGVGDSMAEKLTTEVADTIRGRGRFFDGKHPILSVRSCKEEFPDTNDLQLTAAEKWGVKPVANRMDAERRKNELVFIGSNPFYEVRPLSSSIPYLVPRAAMLLQDIGRNFFDSLQVKQIPLHRIMVSSVLRTKEDVEKLRKHNRNATEKSCHLYGTTFDISYTKFLTVSDPAGRPRRAVRDDSLKYVLSEVLRDLRNNKRCYIKHEVKQSCFHITVR